MINSRLKARTFFPFAIVSLCFAYVAGRYGFLLGFAVGVSLAVTSIRIPGLVRSENFQKQCFLGGLCFYFFATYFSTMLLGGYDERIEKVALVVSFLIGFALYELVPNSLGEDSNAS